MMIRMEFECTHDQACKVLAVLGDGGTVTVSISRTTGATTDITFTETAATDTTITDLQLRAAPLRVTFQTTVTDSDSTSEATYGLASLDAQGLPALGPEGIPAGLPPLLPVPTGERKDARDFSLIQYPELAAAILAGIIKDRKDPRRKVALTIRSAIG